LQRSIIWWRVVLVDQRNPDPVGEFENRSPAEPSAWSDTNKGEPGMATETSAYERLTGGNRKQRKDLQRRLYSGDPGLDVVHANAAGIDIGNESHFVAVPPGRDAEPVREFGSWTADLERMAVWLKSCGIETVAMQSTGVYWGRKRPAVLRSCRGVEASHRRGRHPH
jgi:hypothetical protein